MSYTYPPGVLGFLVVWVGQRTGRRCPVRDPHATLERALLHKTWCERDAARFGDGEDVYAVDELYIGSDGQRHVRFDVHELAPAAA